MKTISVESLSIISFSNIPVVTTELLASLYGTEPDYIRKNFNRNSGRFVIGKHYFLLENEELREFKHSVWLWDYANRSQALFRELYPALKQIQSNYSGRCYNYGHEFSYVIGMARDVLINHTRDVDINEPDGPTNLSAWVRLKNKELPPSLHHY
ncbi:hypothetical protein EZP01_004606 [Escherichia coli]|nr:hypothetical protein [Escherichia coli]